MSDGPIRIFLLCGADECALNESLRKARIKTTIKELEIEYENRYKLFENNINRLTHLSEYQNCITAYVEKDHMWFYP